MIHRLVRTCNRWIVFNRCPDANGRALAEPADDFDIAAEAVRTFFDADQSEPSATLAHRVEIESYSVIRDRQLDRVTRSGARDREAAGLAMRDAISQRFLRDAVEADGDIRIEIAELSGRRE